MKEILKLINENPDLPVFAKVSQEECFDSCFDHSWIMGRFESASIEEYIEGKHAIYIKSDLDYIDEILGDLIDYDEAEQMTEEELNARMNNLPWKKAIFIEVGAY